MPDALDEFCEAMSAFVERMPGLVSIALTNDAFDKLDALHRARPLCGMPMTHFRGIQITRAP